jgi:hypothetical protein
MDGREVNRTDPGSAPVQKLRTNNGTVEALLFQALLVTRNLVVLAREWLDRRKELREHLTKWCLSSTASRGSSGQEDSPRDSQGNSQEDSPTDSHEDSCSVALMLEYVKRLTRLPRAQLDQESLEVFLAREKTRLRVKLNGENQGSGQKVADATREADEAIRELTGHGDSHKDSHKHSRKREDMLGGLLRRGQQKGSNANRIDSKASDSFDFGAGTSKLELSHTSQEAEISITGASDTESSAEISITSVSDTESSAEIPSVEIPVPAAAGGTAKTSGGRLKRAVLPGQVSKADASGTLASLGVCLAAGTLLLMAYVACRRIREALRVYREKEEEGLGMAVNAE